MPDSATNPSQRATENRYSDRRLRGRPDAGNLPRVDGGAEEGIDPALPARAPREGGEVRVPDPARAEGPVERVLRSQGGDAVPGAAAARGARLRLEPLAGADERYAAEVLSAHGPLSRGAPGGPRDLGRDDARRGAGPGRRPMTAADDYLNEIRRAMAGMSNPIRQDILRELKGHIAESSAANGGNMSASLAALGSAREVGHRYRELYGYGTLFKILFSAIAIVLGILSLPALLIGTDGAFPLLLSLVFVIAAAAWILWVSVRAGYRVGITVGLAAMAGRLIASGCVATTAPNAINR